MTNDERPASQTPKDTRKETEAQPRFNELRDVRRTPLGNLRTDEEARLAAEIEKLRD